MAKLENAKLYVMYSFLQSSLWEFADPIASLNHLFIEGASLFPEWSPNSFSSCKAETLYSLKNSLSPHLSPGPDGIILLAVI